jgi:hypothetical protein
VSHKHRVDARAGLCKYNNHFLIDNLAPFRAAWLPAAFNHPVNPVPGRANTKFFHD